MCVCVCVCVRACVCVRVLYNDKHVSVHISCDVDNENRLLCAKHVSVWAI